MPKIQAGRICRLCKKLKPIINFGKYNLRCRDCRSEIERVKFNTDPEYRKKVLERNRRHRERNRAQLNARRRSQYAQDPAYRETMKANAKKQREGRSPEKQEQARLSARKRWEEDPEYRKKHLYDSWVNSLKRNYGMTVNDYQSLYALQEGRCACCKKPREKLDVDHNHETGEIRGLLCRACNKGIGGLGDNLEGVMRAVEYLQKPKIKRR